MYHKYLFGIQNCYIHTCFLQFRYRADGKGQHEGCEDNGKGKNQTEFLLHFFSP